MAVASQSVCQGKSSLMLLTSSPRSEGARRNAGSNCNFMSISCSTNQGEQETRQPEEIFLLLAESFLCFGFPLPFLGYYSNLLCGGSRAVLEAWRQRVLAPPACLW